MNERYVGVVVAVVMAATPVRAACDYLAGSSTTSFSNVGAYSDPNNIYIDTKTLEASVAFTCSNSGTSCDVPTWSGSIKMVLAEAPDFEVGWNTFASGAGCTFPAGSNWAAPGGTVPCTYPGVAGVNVKVASQASCSGQGGMIDQWRYSQNLVVPPSLRNLDLNMMGDYPGARATLSNIPVGVPFRVYGIHATPAGSDVLTVRVEGAGISFTRTYGAQTDDVGKPIDLYLKWGNDPDAAASVVATQVGDIELWAELNGVKSSVVTLHADTRSSSNSGTGGGTGSSGTNNTPTSGCSSVGLAVSALGALLLRRRRS